MHRGAWWATVHGITESDTTEQLSLSQGTSTNGQVESERRSVVSHSLQPHGLYSPWNSPGQNTGVGSHSLLHRIFPAQGLNPDLLHCRWIL